MELNLNQNHHFAEAVVLEKPNKLSLKKLQMDVMKTDDILVSVDHSGISTGTERLLYEGRMPNFPGMGYPLVPGYESIGTVEESGSESDLLPGEKVFVPGAKCFGEFKSLFGGTASKLVVSSKRVCKVPQDTNEEGALLALAATAHHIFTESNDYKPDIIVGHGALGRLIAKIAVLNGGNPTVIEADQDRRKGNFEYEVISPLESKSITGDCLVDASGDSTQLNNLIKLLKPHGEIVLAGFYDKPLSFDFAPAFLREAKIRVSAQWTPNDLKEVSRLFAEKKINFEDLISHRVSVDSIVSAYEIAFNDPSCLKMVINWKGLS
jgi:3-hydroxyethyl bacteriochlorophyllide a dehydrogenase